MATTETKCPGCCPTGATTAAECAMMRERAEAGINPETLPWLDRSCPVHDVAEG